MNSSKVTRFDEYGSYFFTLEIVDGVDVFTRPVYKQIVVHTLNHYIDNKGLIVYGWCLMTNRLYLMAQAEKNLMLGDIHKGFKQFTSEKIIETIHTEPAQKQAWMLPRFEKLSGLFHKQKRYECWMKIDNPIALDMRRPEMIAEQLEFIHNVPVKERIVQYPADYYYSSAKDYADGVNGLVKIKKLSAIDKALDDIENRKSSFKVKYKN